MIARSLRTQRKQMIAVMIGEISNAFYHPIVRTIQDVAGTRGYDVTAVDDCSRDLPRIGRQLADILFERIDGMWLGRGASFRVIGI
jgi:DNA-binding LacI/PurR family transcriptional regulator